MSEFDLSIYFPLPLLTTEGYVSLSKTLFSVKPEQPPGQAKQAIAGLEKIVSEAEAGLVERIDEDLSTGRERSFDIFVDRVWSELRERLEFFENYNHDGVAMFTDEDRAKLGLDERLEQARLAAKMLERMFGSGSDFLRAPMAQQATHMAARLNWVDAKDLHEDLEKLVGAELTSLVQRAQIRYEAMVSDRSSRAGKSAADIRALRDHLRRQLYVYVSAIGAMYDFQQPESAAVVETALRPILITRQQSRRKPGSTDDAESGADEAAEGAESDEVEVDGEGGGGGEG